MRGGLRITGRQSSIFAPKKCNLDIAPHTLPRQSACVLAVRGGLLTAHCQARLSGFNRRMAAKAFALLAGLDHRDRGVSINQCSAFDSDKSYE